MRKEIVLGLGLLGGLGLHSPTVTAAEPPPDLGVFFQLVDRDPANQARAYKMTEARWDPAFVAPQVDLASVSYDERIFPLLQRRTGEKRRDDLKVSDGVHRPFANSHPCKEAQPIPSQL